MAEQKGARIVIDKDRIRVQDKQTGQVHDLGPKEVTQGQTEKRVRDLKQSLERSGNRVDVKEMDR